LIVTYIKVLKNSCFSGGNGRQIAEVGRHGSHAGKTSCRHWEAIGNCIR